MTKKTKLAEVIENRPRRNQRSITGGFVAAR